MKPLRYLLEAIGVCIYFILCKLSGYRLSATISAKIATILGPKSRRHQIAHTNLSIAYKTITRTEQSTLLHGMWDNLGRTAANYAHLTFLSSGKGQDYITVDNQPLVKQLTAHDGPILFLCAHKANWEISVLALAYYGLHCSITYRPTNNPWVNRLVQSRRKTFCPYMYPKGFSAIKHTINLLKNNGNIGWLIDQKANDGIPFPFFGTDAMTSTAVTHLYQKYRPLIVYVDVTRHDNHYFTVTPSLIDIPSTGNELDILQSIHTEYEHAISRAPEQWLWIHRRWPKHHY